MNWIRIATGMKSDPKVGRIAMECGVPMAHAVGLVTCALMEFPEHARAGDVAQVPDVVLEEWAGWRGEPGRFAAVFRAQFCDPTGAVGSWERHNGKALRKAQSDIERKRAARERRELGAQTARAETQNGAETARAEVRNGARKISGRRGNGQVDETRRDETNTSSSYEDDDGASAAAASPNRDGLLAHFPDPHHREAVAGYIRSAQFPDAVAAHIAKAIDPHGGGDAADHVGQALHEMRLNGVGAFRSAVFAGFLRRVKEPLELTAAEPTWESLMTKAGVRDVA